MRKLILLFLGIFSTFISFAGTISGMITDEKGNPLPYASVSIKGSNKGANANSSGKYSFALSPGQYTLVCQFVGYSRTEKNITVTDAAQTVDFVLHVQELTLNEVVIKKGEDPAYEIIRQAIKKRSYYNNQVDSFTVQVYIKGLLRSRGLPQKILGKKVEREANDGLDSMGKGILFLSESITKVSYAKPDKVKLDVISSRESGGGFGLSFPFFINFYQNNVSVFDNNINPRGFISPIADGALNYYRFKYEGFFIEDGKTVNQIRVTPKRKNEPLFTGTIQIVEDDWRIHSLDLLVTKSYQLELMDTLKVSQLAAPVEGDVWKTKNQVTYVAAKKFGVDVAGNFVNIYSDYDINPGFQKKYFGNVLMKYDTAANKRDTNYWNAMRPIALEPDEKRDFIFKDSVAKAERDSSFSRTRRDSLRRNQKPLKVLDIFWGQGLSRNFYGRKTTLGYSVKPLITQLQYNTVEGLSLNVNQTFSFNRHKRDAKYGYALDWNTRYGFSNTHLNSYGVLTIRDRKQNRINNQALQLSGGKRLSQFNQDNPIDRWTNAFYTLFFKDNYMKLYENWFGKAEFSGRTESGVRYKVFASWEERLPVENTTDFSFFKRNDSLLPNHPYELAGIPFDKHQAFIAGFTVSWQPGQKYIQYPRYKMPLGSDKPTFELEYTKGINGLLSSDVDYDKWKLSVTDKMNFKLGGEFHYRFSVGGFINSKKVEIPDLQHFNGNQTFYNFKYLNSFQLAPYYRYSNAESFYAMANVEHHLNGLLTNKVPLLSKLKWNLVLGANAFYVDKDKYYLEAFAGLENIFKLFRVDFVNAYQPGLGNKFGVRVGLGGILGGKISFGN